MPRVQVNLPSFKSAAAVLAVALVAASVVAAIFKLAPLVALQPGAVFAGLVWLPFTYGFIESSPLGVIFGAVILWSIGGALEYAWGRRRLATFAVGVTVLAGLATVLLSLVWPALQVARYAGGGTMAGAVWVAYGLANGSRPMNFWGLGVTGNIFALIGAGFVFLNAAFVGLSAVVPDAFALLFTFLASRGVSPGRLWERLRSWQLERTLKRRSSQLRVVSDDRNMPRDSDRFLH